MTRPGHFELVLICTGNRVRSPIAEGFLRHLLADLPVRLRSLGTLELTGGPALPEALEASSALGLDISAHQARALHGEDLGPADLVLGFERSHIVSAVIDAGAARERVFSFPELVQLIEETEPPRATDPLERARQTIARAHAQRGGTVPSTLAELADPLGQSRKVYSDTVEGIRDLSMRLAVGLFGKEAIRPLPRADGRPGAGS
jgi:protein-tyrosine-phosphatase